ncbi:hypothetical protein RIVM261_042690 [Rivularia sp. IAM M-261]|nr:hypothetical protein RIVM261_042690 [Rivularia sp. IAM M-261]
MPIKSITPVARLENFQVDVSLPRSLETKRKLKLQKAIERCLIYNTLRQLPQITIHIITAPTLIK